MSIHIVKPGLQTSVQDLGRTGLMRYGISRGGAADPVALQLANLLLGNPADWPSLEVALIGPTIEFHCNLSIAVTGARFELEINGESVESNRVLQMRRGDVLAFGRLLSGARAYIAFSARMDVPQVFGSCATHLLGGFGGLEGRAVKSGDNLRFTQHRIARPRTLEKKFQLNYSRHPQLRLVAGVEADYFSPKAIDALYRCTYQISPRSNRMGIRLSGEPLGAEKKSQIVSSGLCPGTVQIPPDGQPIIAFVEGQTIGGYPRIAHVIRADQQLLGQLQARDKVSFWPVTMQEAHKILAAKARLLSTLGVKFSV